MDDFLAVLGLLALAGLFVYTKGEPESEKEKRRNVDDYAIDATNITNGQYIDHQGNHCEEFNGEIINIATGQKVN